jgi:methionyl-tRNA formyltransferase
MDEEMQQNAACLRKNALSIAVLAGDNVFSYLMARDLFKREAIADVYLSNYNSGSLKNIKSIFNKTSLAYFIYRSFVQALSRLLPKHSIAHEARQRNITIRYLSNKKDFDSLKTRYDLSIAFNFDIIIPSHYIYNNRVGVVNIHASNLPIDKGISPVVWAFCRGDNDIWISFYLMDGGIDSGLILNKTKLTIKEDWSLFRTYCEVLLYASASLVDLIQNIESLKEKRIGKPFDDIRVNSYNSWPDAMLHKKMRKFRRTYFKLSDFKYLNSMLRLAKPN